MRGRIGGQSRVDCEEGVGQRTPRIAVGKSTRVSTHETDDSPAASAASTHWPNTGKPNPMWEAIPPDTSGANGPITHRTEWAAANGGSNERDQVGVGERVRFAAGAAGTWSATGGTRRGEGSEFSWTAPAAPGTTTISFSSSAGAAPVTKGITVHAPTRIVLTKTGDDTMAPGVMGAGFKATVTLHPLDVSFAATEWKEDSGQAGEGAQGYFATQPQLTHDANPRWIGIGAGNGGPSDHVAFGGFPSPWTAGRFHWSIGQRWRLRTGSAPALFETLAQTCVIEEDGRTTVSKGGASATRSAEGSAGAKAEAVSSGAFGVGDSSGARKPRSPETWEVVNKHSGQFLVALMDRIKAHPLPAPHPRLGWFGADQARQAIAARIYTYVHAVEGQTLKRLMMLCPSSDLYALVHDARKGPEGTRNRVAAIRVAAAFDEPLRQSIVRMGMRTVVQMDKSGGIPPRADSVVASCPLDELVVEVIVTPAITQYHWKKKGAANDTGRQSFRDGVKQSIAYTWLGQRDKKLWNWIHVTEPKSVTAEDIAQLDLLQNGNPNTHSTEAYRIAVNGSYFGIPVETARLIPEARKHAPDNVLPKLDTEDPGPRIAEGAALAQSPISDEAALKSAPKAAKSDLPVTRAIDRTQAQLGFLQTQLAPWKCAGPLKGAIDFVARRETEAISDPKEVARYAAAMTAQERILYAASSEVAEILGDLERSGVTPELSASVTPVVDVLRAYATAAGSSHLSDAGYEGLAEARRKRKLLALALAEAQIKGAATQLNEQSAAEQGSDKREPRAEENIEALPDLTRRAADLRFAAAQGAELDPDDVERLSLDASVVQLRARLVSLGAQSRALQSTASEVGVDKDRHPAGYWSVDMVCGLILTKVTSYQVRLDAAKKWTGPSSDKKVSAKQWENQKLREEVKATETLFTTFVTEVGLQEFFTWAQQVIKNERLKKLIQSIAVQLGVAILTGQVAGMVGAAIRGATAAAELGATLREAGLLYRGASIIAQAGAQTGAQAAVGGEVTAGTVAENALGLVLTSAAMRPFMALLDDGVAVEQQVIRSWAEFAKKSGKVILEAAVDAGAGITAAALARTVVHGGKLDMTNSEEWITQGLAFAANRMVHGHAMKMYARLEEAGAKWKLDTGPLKQKALDLANRAKELTKPTPEQALEQLAQRHKLQLEEQNLLRSHSARTQSSDSTNDRTAETYASQIESVAAASLQLSGLSPVVQGHVYEGSKSDINAALKDARNQGVDFKRLADGTYKVGTRVITINEIGAAKGAQASPTGQVARLGREVLLVGPDLYRVQSGKIDLVRSEMLANGSAAGEVHYDFNRSVAYFEVTRAGGKSRFEHPVKRIRVAAEIQTLSNGVVGEPTSLSRGHELISRLNRGDNTALHELGVTGTAKFLNGIEFGLGMTADGRHIVIRGARHHVDWSHFPGVTPIAHTHPAVELQGRRATVKEIFSRTEVPSIHRAQIFPSGADFVFAAEHGLHVHQVHTEFVLEGTSITTSKSGDKSPRISFAIKRSFRYGIDGKGRSIYLSNLDMTAGGKLIRSAKVWTVKSDVGDSMLHMSRPPGVQKTRRDGRPLRR